MSSSTTRSQAEAPTETRTSNADYIAEFEAEKASNGHPCPHVEDGDSLPCWPCFARIENAKERNGGGQ